VANWAELLRNRGYNVATRKNAFATGSNYLSALEEMVEKCNKAGHSRMVLQNSSHGTYVTDNDGDEADGRDEALYLRGRHSLVTDDEIYSRLKLLRADSLAVLICDSCFSGTMHRGRPAVMKSRFILCPKHKRKINSDSSMFQKTADLPNVALLSACAEGETAADAYISGRYNGAFSYYACGYLRANQTADFKSFRRGIGSLLPNRKYSQTPQVLFHAQISEVEVL
jgi:hypothetical protein